MDYLFAGTKKVAILERWLLVQVQLLHNDNSISSDYQWWWESRGLRHPKIQQWVFRRECELDNLIPGFSHELVWVNSHPNLPKVHFGKNDNMSLSYQAVKPLDFGAEVCLLQMSDVFAYRKPPK